MKININLSKEFGVPEDVEFIFGAGTIPYKIYKNILYVKYQSGWEESEEGLNAINGHDVHIIPNVITDAEKVILENLSEEYRDGWIARDETGYGEIFAYSTEPYNDCGIYGNKDGHCFSIPYSHLLN